MRGSYARAAGILCAIEKNTTLTNSTTPTMHNGVTFSESDSCFQDGTLDVNNDGDVADTATISLRETALTGTGYDRKLEVQVGAATYNTAGANTMTIYTKDSDNIVAAKTIESNAVTEAIVDKSNDLVFYDNRNYTGKAHDRILIKGTVDNSGVLSNVTNIAAIEAQGAVTPTNTVVYVTDGTNKLYDQFSGSSRVTGYPKCTGTGTGTGGTGNCITLTIPYSTGFLNFSGASQSTYNNGNVSTFNAPITMSF